MKRRTGSRPPRRRAFRSLPSVLPSRCRGRRRLRATSWAPGRCSGWSRDAASRDSRGSARKSARRGGRSLSAAAQPAARAPLWVQPCPSFPSPIAWTAGNRQPRYRSRRGTPAGTAIAAPPTCEHRPRQQLPVTSSAAGACVRAYIASSRWIPGDLSRGELAAHHQLWPPRPGAEDLARGGLLPWPRRGRRALQPGGSWGSVCERLGRKSSCLLQRLLSSRSRAPLGDVDLPRRPRSPVQTTLCRCMCLCDPRRGRGTGAASVTASPAIPALRRNDTSDVRASRLVRRRPGVTASPWACSSPADRADRLSGQTVIVIVSCACFASWIVAAEVCPIHPLRRRARADRGRARGQRMRTAA